MTEESTGTTTAAVAITINLCARSDFKKIWFVWVRVRVRLGVRWAVCWKLTNVSWRFEGADSLFCALSYLIQSNPV